MTDLTIGSLAWDRVLGVSGVIVATRSYGGVTPVVLYTLKLKDGTRIQRLASEVVSIHGRPEPVEGAPCVIDGAVTP